MWHLHLESVTVNSPYEVQRAATPSDEISHLARKSKLIHQRDINNFSMARVWLNQLFCAVLGRKNALVSSGTTCDMKHMVCAAPIGTGSVDDMTASKISRMKCTGLHYQHRFSQMLQNSVLHNADVQ